jgi:UDP-2,3-diacylglucosamine hydrolase
MKTHKLGLIAGNGQFPFLVLKEAVKQGMSVAVAAIREETDPRIEQAVDSGQEAPSVRVRWIGLGQLGKLIRFFKEEGVQEAVMAGQVRHAHIFSKKGLSPLGRLSALPDLKMIRLLLSLPQKNTESLIGAVADALQKEGVRLVDSTLLLKHLLARPGVLSRRQPTVEEWKDIRYGRQVAREIARLDLGQTVVIKNQAVVAVEAMEGTDETVERASRLAAGGRLTVVKMSRPEQDMRFDVPVVGMRTLQTLGRCHVSALGLEAGRTLVLDGREFFEEADRLKLAIQAE